MQSGNPGMLRATLVFALKQHKMILCKCIVEQSLLIKILISLNNIQEARDLTWSDASGVLARIFASFCRFLNKSRLRGPKIDFYILVVYWKVL
jgi:hypothetical protein